MKQQKLLNTRKLARARRSSARIIGSTERPRLAVFRSNKALAVQLIDDTKHRTIASASTRDLKEKQTKTLAASSLGEVIAKKAVAAGVSAVVFDRRSYRYHGRVKALAEGARAGGLEF